MTLSAHVHIRNHCNNTSMNHLIEDKTAGNIISGDDGKIMRFSFDSFVDMIVKGDFCFICGESPTDKPFNNEHVVPNWILKNYETPDAFMILPNSTTIKNSSYVAPCCQDCNTELGRKIETPISDLLKQPFNILINICREINYCTISCSSGCAFYFLTRI
jgi:hypothetical protein